MVELSEYFNINQGTAGTCATEWDACKAFY